MRRAISMYIGSKLEKTNIEKQFEINNLILHQKSFNFLSAPILFSVTVVNDVSGCFKSLKGVSVGIDDCLSYLKSLDGWLSCLNSPEGVSVGLDESFW